jgi:hypothetical protein
MAMDIVFQREKKQNSNRAKVVGVVSVLAKVKHGPALMGLDSSRQLFRPKAPFWFGKTFL